MNEEKTRLDHSKVNANIHIIFLIELYLLLCIVTLGVHHVLSLHTNKITNVFFFSIVSMFLYSTVVYILAEKHPLCLFGNCFMQLGLQNSSTLVFCNKDFFKDGNKCLIRDFSLGFFRVYLYDCNHCLILMLSSKPAYTNTHASKLTCA